MSALSESGGLVHQLVTGGITAAITKTYFAPLERVKLLLQVQYSQQSIAPDQRYKGMLDCFSRLFREQGIRSMWRGNFASVLKFFPEHAMAFAFNDTYRHLFLNDVDLKTQFWRYFAGVIAAGGMAGATALCVVYPIDFARTRLALDIGRTPQTREFRGLTHCFVKTLNSDGPVGLYRGFFISIQGVILYRAAYFGLFEGTRAWVSAKGGNQNSTVAQALPHVVTATSGILLYPWDTVRRRMMMQSGRSDTLYKGSLDCAKKIVQKEGARGLYKGLLPSFLQGGLLLGLYSKFNDR